MIEFNQVTKKYYSLTALQDISLTVPRGEVVGLLGPNGAGKTTLIKLVAGIINPSSGAIRATEPQGGWPSIGFKPERLVFPGDLVVSQYLEMIAGLCNVGRPYKDNVVLESLARVNLLASANKQIKTLSKGMRQRLGLAQALIGDPDLLLLDEPSSGLDPAGQEEMHTYIEELRAAGKTILMSSHQLHEVTRVCTYLIILKEGRVLYRNPMAEALTLRPHVAIQVDRQLDGAKTLLEMVHPHIVVDGSEVVLRDEAIGMRRQVLSILINQGYDIVKVEQRRVTLAEIYSEAVRMIQRILILTAYFSKAVFFSLTGLVLLIISLIYWAVFFPPGQGTPDVENYIILVGALGAAATFLVTLAVSAKAGRMENYPMLVRLPSRVEYLVAVLLSALFLGFVLQLLVAGLALIRGPSLTAAYLLAIPPLWVSVNLLAAALAVHATDLVTTGWSRVILFGLLAITLILNSAAGSPDIWFSDRLNDLSSLFSRVNLLWFSDLAGSAAAWAYETPLTGLANVAGLLFWPFRAMSDAIFAGGFSPSQALAPAVLILYGSILFLIAATLFSGKDLEFLE